MANLNFDTARLHLRQLTPRDLSDFYNLISDPIIKKYFRYGDSFGEVAESIISLPATEDNAIKLGIFSKYTNQLIGYISGSNLSHGELLTEFFIGKYFREQHYALEVLNSFFNFCHSKGYNCFRFAIEDGNIASLKLLQHFPITHYPEEDFNSKVETNRHFNVYKLYYC